MTRTRMDMVSGWVSGDLAMREPLSVLALWFEICFVIYESSPEHAITKNVKS